MEVAGVLSPGSEALGVLSPKISESPELRKPEDSIEYRRGPELRMPEDCTD